jgi:hypothetical protein
LFNDAVCNIEILVREPERKRQLGKPARRWEDNIRMDLREIWWEDVGSLRIGTNGGK